MGLRQVALMTSGKPHWLSTTEGEIAVRRYCRRPIGRDRRFVSLVSAQQHDRRRFSGVNRKGNVMSKHQANRQHSLRARTLIGGAVISGALLGVGAPAGIAAATPSSGPFHFDSPAVQARETAIKSRIVTGIETSRVGSAYLTHLATEHPVAAARLNAAIANWVTH
jgi:hypothetical protein